MILQVLNLIAAFHQVNICLAFKIDFAVAGHLFETICTVTAVNSDYRMSTKANLGSLFSVQDEDYSEPFFFIHLHQLMCVVLYYCSIWLQ